MSKTINLKTENPIIIRALNLFTNELIAEGSDGDKVLEKAIDSGQEYILDFETSPKYNFIF